MDCSICAHSLIRANAISCLSIYILLYAHVTTYEHVIRAANVDYTYTIRLTLTLYTLTHCILTFISYTLTQYTYILYSTIHILCIYTGYGTNDINSMNAMKNLANLFYNTKKYEFAEQVRHYNIYIYIYSSITHIMLYTRILTPVY